MKARGALDEEITASGARQQPREKQKRKRTEEDDPKFISSDLSNKILTKAQQLLKEERKEDGKEDESLKRMRHISLGKETKDSDEEDADEFPEDQDYDPGIIELDPKDEEELSKFLVKRGDDGPKTLYDIIQAKIEAKKDDAEWTLGAGEGNEFNIRDMDPEVVEMYKEVGQLLSRYRTGKLPKAFKIIPNMVNWEQLLYLTDPDHWTAAAMYQATRIFASNLNPRMAQRFYNLILLPRMRDDIEEYKKLNYYLYQALCKTTYKPAAFYKGIILPLVECGTCTLREATIFSSVLARGSLPIFHSAAAMLKIAEMEYTGSSSVFLRTLIDKKYNLPYKAIDAICAHFLRQKNEERDMPVLWHQCLLSFVKQYRTDLNDAQKDAIKELIRFQGHYLISPEVERELSGQAAEAAKPPKVEFNVVNVRPDTMEF